MFSVIVDDNNILIFKDFELLRSFTYGITYSEEKASFKTLLAMAFERLYNEILKDKGL